MDSRLLRFVELWSQSLEGGLDEAAQSELDGYLQDDTLVEQLGSWQAQHSAIEGAEPAATPALDRRVLGQFRQRALLRKLGPWALGLGLALGGAVFLYRRASADKYQFVAVPVDDVATVPAPAHSSALIKAQARPTLGLPPGFGSRPTQLQPAIGRNVTMEWTLVRNGLARVQVLDAQGRAVKHLWQGQAMAGSYRSAWDGTDDLGRPLSAGRYRIHAAAGQQALADRDVELLPTP